MEKKKKNRNLQLFPLAISTMAKKETMSSTANYDMS